MAFGPGFFARRVWPGPCRRCVYVREDLLTSAGHHLWLCERPARDQEARANALASRPLTPKAAGFLLPGWDDE